MFSHMVANLSNFRTYAGRLFLPISRSTYSSCILPARSFVISPSPSRFQPFISFARSTHTSGSPSGVPPLPAEPILRFSPPRPKRIVIGVTGATGGILAIRLLQALKELGIETHLIMSKWAVATLKYETDMTADEVRRIIYI